MCCLRIPLYVKNQKKPLNPLGWLQSAFFWCQGFQVTLILGVVQHTPKIDLFELPKKTNGNILQDLGVVGVENQNCFSMIYMSIPRFQ